MREDDYKNAIKLAAGDLAKRDPELVAKASGASYAPTHLGLGFIGSPVRVNLPSWEPVFEPPKEGPIPLTDQVLILHYLQGAKELPLTGDLVAYRQIPGGEFYFDAFHRRAEIPLASVFGTRKGVLTKAAAVLGGTPKEGFGDEAAIFRVLPYIDILVMLYHQDEEFEAHGQVLFDRVIGQYLSSEDISWLGSGLVYRLMGISKGL
ncbi:MAG: DUF3786 domain-containing protein [Deltaproteobacteria bacterium]|jgi:hypothetical protein|nr:DUF3786 domain-containing protein [Deltaproteobacteria bacterium]